MKIDTRVKWTSKYINNWIFTDNNAACHEVPGIGMTTYGALEYEQEILLAMFTLMGEPVYGAVKGPGCDENTVLVYFSHAGCSYWGYHNIKDLKVVS